MSGHRVVIVGGGLAGLSAAEALSRADCGLSIQLLEARRRCGGRAGSYDDPETQTEIDYCQHAAMGCCVNFLDMLHHCGLSRHLKRYRELTFLHPQHPPSRFAPNVRLPAPLHLIGTVDALRYLNRDQKRQIKRGLWKLFRTPSDHLSDVRASDWLAAANQSPETVAGFWDVILVSALGEQSRHVSMSAARKVLVDGFAIARGASDVLVPTCPLAELFGRLMVDVLVDRGVRVDCGKPVQSVGGDRIVRTRDASIAADAVVLAVPWHQLEKLLGNAGEGILPNRLPAKRLANIPTSPITGIHLWFDRPITSLDHAVMVGTTAQWIFRDPCDRHADTTPTQQHYYQVVISASVDTASIFKQQLIDQVLGELRHAFPAAREAKLIRHRVVTDPKSVFSIRPEVDAIRPHCHTEVEGLLLAGDWTQTGWPATMEGAVISGRAAADQILTSLQSIPPGSTVPQRPDRYKTARLLQLKAGWLARCLIRC